MTCLRAALQRSMHGDVAAVVRHADERVSRGHGFTVPTAFLMNFRSGLRGGSRPQRPAEIRADRHRQPSSPTAGLKPLADGTRKMPPFGSPKGAGRHQRTSRGTGGIARSQVDPPQGGTGARVHRHPGLRHRLPLRSPSDRQSRLREGRLNGLPEAFAEVLRHRIGGGIRVAEAAPTGALDARFVVEPAYSLGPHSVSPLRRLAGGCAPSDPRNGNGAP